MPHLFPRKSKTVDDFLRGLNRIQQFYDNVRIRALFGWGRFEILLVTGKPKKFKESK